VAQGTSHAGHDAPRDHGVLRRGRAGAVNLRDTRLPLLLALPRACFDLLAVLSRVRGRAGSRQLSAALHDSGAPPARTAVCNTHGVRDQFLALGSGRAALEATGGAPLAGRGVYFLGKKLWAKVGAVFSHTLAARTNPRAYPCHAPWGGGVTFTPRFRLPSPVDLLFLPRFARAFNAFFSRRATGNWCLF